jgi:hypothetical protein
MAIPDERKVALSIPTQTAMKGLRDGLRNFHMPHCNQRDIFEIDFKGF